MKKNKNNRHGFGDYRESILYLLLPLLCFASILRSCGARSAEIPDAMQQTASERQYVTNESSKAEGSRSQKTGSQAETSQSRAETSQSSTEKTTVRANPYNPANFSYLDEISENIAYFDENYESLQGIDVSDHQGEIDWQAVADAGYDFVFVRVGFRGYGEDGTLNEDTMAIQYMQEAKAAGLEVGAYFFSQAVSEEEAEEEALFACDIIKRSGVEMSLPLVYDPELIEGTRGRADDISSEQVSANAKAFRKAAAKALGCRTAIYAKLYWEKNYFDAETLNDFEIWYAGYEDAPQTPYHFTWWQYSETGSVPGIKGDMDLNLWIRRVD